MTGRAEQTEGEADVMAHTQETEPAFALSNEGDAMCIPWAELVMGWEAIEEAIRGFFFEKDLPADTADEWTEEIATIVSEHLPEPQVR